MSDHSLLCVANPGRHGGPGRGVAIPTLGGRQLWADVYLYAGWRIQEHVVTGHARLLDPADGCHAWGRLRRCHDAFRDIRRRGRVAPAGRHLVLLLHGLGRTKGSLAGLAAALGGAGYEVAALSYPSTRRGIAGHADRLVRLLDGLEDTRSLSFVTHSLGAMVVRAALARPAEWRRRIEVNAVLMIGPPSRGSVLAARLARLPPLAWLAGASVRDLAGGAAAKLPAPPVPFAVIAGGRGTATGYNPLLPGDDDGVLAVAETRLDGARDFLVVNQIHTFLANHPETIAAALAFLRYHRFAAPDGRGRDACDRT